MKDRAVHHLDARCGHARAKGPLPPSALERHSQQLPAQCVRGELPAQLGGARLGEESAPGDKDTGSPQHKRCLADGSLPLPSDWLKQTETVVLGTLPWDLTWKLWIWGPYIGTWPRGCCSGSPFLDLTQGLWFWDPPLCCRYCDNILLCSMGPDSAPSSLHPCSLAPPPTLLWSPHIGPCWDCLQEPWAGWTARRVSARAFAANRTSRDPQPPALQVWGSELTRAFQLGLAGSTGHCAWVSKYGQTCFLSPVLYTLDTPTLSSLAPGQTIHRPAPQQG